MSFDEVGGSAVIGTRALKSLSVNLFDRFVEGSKCVINSESFLKTTD
jgi:hypothetical protein